MSKGNTFENDILKALFHDDTTNLDAILALTNFYVAIHTADPGEAGDQTTSEVSYTGYQRVAVARTSSGWNIVNNTFSPVDAITFPEVLGAAGALATFASIGTASSGTGKILYRGPIDPTISCDLGYEPSLNTDSLGSEN